MARPTPVERCSRPGRRGVGCLCLSVGADTSTPALRRVFGSAAHATVPAADRLPPLVGPLFAAALSTAESQRRRYQRIQRTRERLEIEKETTLSQSTRPYYVPVGNEEAVFVASYRQGLAVLLKGPTGCGKTRFVEAMAHDLGPTTHHRVVPDDLTAADLVGSLPARGRRHEVGRRAAHACRPRGRDLLPRRSGRGAPGHHRRHPPARRPPAPVAHRPARDRPRAADGFCLVVSYNPGYQSVLKDLKDSTRQRMVAIELDFPPRRSRRRSSRMRPGSTTTPPPASSGWPGDPTSGAFRPPRGRIDPRPHRRRPLVSEGLSLTDAARAAIAGPLTDDPTVVAGLYELIASYLDERISED